MLLTSRIYCLLSNDCLIKFVQYFSFLLQELLGGSNVNEVKACFAGLERSATNATGWPNEEVALREIIRKLMEEWKLFYKRAQEFSVHLQTIPDQWETYRKK